MINNKPKLCIQYWWNIQICFVAMGTVVVTIAKIEQLELGKWLVVSGQIAVLAFVVVVSGRIATLAFDVVVAAAAAAVAVAVAVVINDVSSGCGNTKFKCHRVGQ